MDIEKGGKKGENYQCETSKAFKDQYQSHSGIIAGPGKKETNIPSGRLFMQQDLAFWGVVVSVYKPLPGA